VPPPQRDVATEVGRVVGRGLGPAQGRDAAEDLRQLLTEQLEKNYSNVKVTFKNLEDLDTLVNLSGVPTASARFVLNLTFDPNPAQAVKTTEPTREAVKSK
jgi:hypothetical protein